MRLIPLLTLLAACSGGSDKGTDTPIDTDESDTEVTETDTVETDDTEIEEEPLPSALTALDGALLGWFLADETTAGEHVRLPGTRGAFSITPYGPAEDTAGEPIALLIVEEGGRRALQVGGVNDGEGGQAEPAGARADEAAAWGPPGEATLPGGAGLSAGTLAARYRYLNAPGWYEYILGLGAFSEGAANGGYFGVARFNTEVGGLYTYDNTEVVHTDLADTGGTWHTIVARFDGTGIRLRLDGVAGIAEGTGATTWSVDRALHLGHMDGGRNAGSVQIREFFAFDTALTDEQVVTVETWLAR